MRKPNIYKWETELSFGGKIVLTVEPEEHGNLEAKVWIYRKSGPGAPETPTILNATLTDIEFLMRDLADCAEVMSHRAPKAIEA
ncbi:MAG: hypothetical protein RBU21_11250 [FCB group bacterium]|jgi:hypothetical protein|nr:hypothetical protein [FCB group bacterium]